MFLEIILIILPVLFAGLTFIYYLKWNKIAFLNTPLDFGLKINKKRVFGVNKTIKGPIIMGLFTAAYGFIIFRLFENYQSNHIDSPNLFLALLIIGVSYSLGELPNSFIKRQLGILPGSIPKEGIPKYIFRTVDTFDSLLFVGLFYYLLFRFSILSIIYAILLGGIIHLITDKLMMHLRIKGSV